MEQTPQFALSASLGQDPDGTGPEKAYSYGILNGVSYSDAARMSGGFDWNENNNSYLNGLQASPDYVDYVVTRQPYGSQTFNYSSGLAHVGGEVLERELNRSPSGQLQPVTQKALDFAQQNVFNPIGIEPTRWNIEPNPGGAYVGYGNLYMRPRDLARLGQLYLDMGCATLGAGSGSCPGQQVIDRDWVIESTSRQVSNTGGESCRSPMGYGAWWWVGDFTDQLGRSFGAYHALGFAGQHIMVFPALNMVVVMHSTIVSNSCSHINPNYNLVENYVLPAAVQSPLGAGQDNQLVAAGHIQGQVLGAQTGPEPRPNISNLIFSFLAANTGLSSLLYLVLKGGGVAFF